MSDRYSTLDVVLEQDMRAENVEPIVNAIQALRGVLSVSKGVATLAEHVAEQRVRRELSDKLWQVLFPGPPSNASGGP